MNDGLLENLNILQKYYQKTSDIFRNRAYTIAMYSLSNLEEEIIDISQVKNLKGVGKSILSKIDEYLSTGKISKVEEVKHMLEARTTEEKTIELFKNIWGVGPVKAKFLWDKGFQSIDDIRKQPGILNNQQKIGLTYYDDLLKKLPREKILIFQAVLRYILNKHFGKDTYRMEVAGSYRRGKLMSGDMDVLLTSKTFGLKDVVNVLKELDVISEILSVKDEKFMGIVHCPGGVGFNFRMDIEFLPEEEWGSGILYFTGSKMSNIRMRYQAKKMGMVLNQHGLFRDGVRLPLYTEKDIYNILDMEFVKPTKR